MCRCSESLTVRRALAVGEDVKLGMFNAIVVEIFLFLQTVKFIHQFCDKNLMKMKRESTSLKNLYTKRHVSKEVVIE